MNRHLFAVSAAALLTAAAFIAEVRAEDAPAQQTITVTDKGCEPYDVSIKEGEEIFTIVNGSKKALEWEILDGVKVVFERENILPGFKLDLKPKLKAGTYDMTCGLLSNPKGKLTVTAGTAAPTVAVDPEITKAVEAYRAYAQGEADILVKNVTAFTAAIKGGKLEEAQKLFGPVRVNYERIEPVAELFGDLDPAIDARADDFEKKEQDPTWTGFHRIEFSLFSEKKTDGLSDLADKLLVDVTELQSRIAVMDILPATMVAGAGALIEEVFKSKISGEEDRYSGTDLYDFQANVDGSKKIMELIKAPLEKKDKALLDATSANFTKVDAILAKYKEGEGYKSYSALTEDDRNALKGALTPLAEDLAKLTGALGL
ncbi:iron uptake system protein EfeO [Aestuariivirga litoralis]|uniref:iron uptake system protein EfeO n=1 Tax=Aestuariivirga litoralis TaxID=2650924 RepID=UPI0018C81824|nr:iron uptake system protein EfeO [Aestuariivirga litoralis]MBG1233391.1 iron uptake system protein EfeO [Aestuariivirga litoralis]